MRFGAGLVWISLRVAFFGRELSLQDSSAVFRWKDWEPRHLVRLRRQRRDSMPTKPWFREWIWWFDWHGQDLNQKASAMVQDQLYQTYWLCVCSEIVTLLLQISYQIGIKWRITAWLLDRLMKIFKFMKAGCCVRLWTMNPQFWPFISCRWLPSTRSKNRCWGGTEWRLRLFLNIFFQSFANGNRIGSNSFCQSDQSLWWNSR